MNTEKRKPRVRHRVDQVLHQRMARWNQFVVFAAKRDDANSRIDTAHSRDSIRLESSAIHKALRSDIPCVRYEDQFTAGTAAANHACRRLQITSAIQRYTAHGPNDTFVVGNARRRNKQTPDAGRMRLMLANLLRS